MRRTLFPLLVPLALSAACFRDDGHAGDGGSAEDSGSTGDETSGEGEEGSGDGDGDGDEADEGGAEDTKFDTLAIPDTPSNCGDGGGGEEFSYLWAANSSQGTISKIDTHTVTEVGRFLVRPDGQGDPSRTSVSLSGDVAVANRNGGVTKVYANSDDCSDTNGQPGIQTSNSSAYLAWGEEECIAWHTPMAYESQRPVAWAQGLLDAETCTYGDARLWTSGRNGDTFDVMLLDGDDGTIEETVHPVGLLNDFYGIYGAAVDGDGNFWGTQLGSSDKLIFVSIDDLSYQIWNAPSGPWWYGMTVDSEGYVWMCSETVARFDPNTETFDTAVVGGWTGCMADAGEDGLLWMAGDWGSSVVGVDRHTLQVVANWPTPVAYGISVDFEGYVWAVDGSTAARVDPEDGTVQSYNGLTGAYTYSDMTGFALANAGKPPG
jgi:streptogramin lyase